MGESVNRKCRCCGNYEVMLADCEYCHKCEADRQGLIKAAESLPWQSLSDVPLDAWFRSKSSERASNISRIVQFWVSYNYVDLATGLSLKLFELYDSFEWSMTPLDETSWKPCNMRYRNVCSR